ncbi:NAD(P)/FAD-dependent oxidoreductase [Rasiella sp. SM2506]|uniref:NAD(P)/FAD-dependent oxidoreductase n=1 Tax=Rasiella sp. SM2506 TaxID=3423914 RepID=UPI003D7AB0CD
MQQNTTFDILIIGGGLGGLIAAIVLGKKYKVLLLEKDAYPRHRVCGEYISNEVLPYLQSIGIDPIAQGAKKIDRFEISTHQGKLIKTALPLGGFGMSRYELDNLLYKKAAEFAEIVIETCTQVDFKDNSFAITTKENLHYKATYVIGAFGKRSNVDKYLHRNFIQKKSPWLAVKAHYEHPFEDDVVALHNFKGGYCGLSKIENNAVNACYLTTYHSFKKVKSIAEFQQKVLSANPFLAKFFQNANPLFEEPLTISQISFEDKQPVENHIFMIGDAAGLIHPLCGNGMAMAIHSGKLLSEIFLQNDFNNRTILEEKYTKIWSETFLKRLHTGRRVQGLLLQPSLTKAFFNISKMVPSLLPKIIAKTHGDIVI